MEEHSLDPEDVGKQSHFDKNKVIYSYLHSRHIAIHCRVYRTKMFNEYGKYYLIWNSWHVLLFKKKNLNNDISERAKAFWKKEDIDDLFNVVFGYLDNLKRVLKKNTATDRGWTLPLFHVTIRTCDQLPAVINKSSCLSTRICSGLKAAGGFELFSVRFKSGLFCGSGGHWFR